MLCGMMTRGTNTSTCSDAELREHIAAAAHDVANAAYDASGSTYEILFAENTLQRLTRELRRRNAADSEIVPELASEASSTLPA